MEIGEKGGNVPPTSLFKRSHPHARRAEVSLELAARIERENGDDVAATPKAAREHGELAFRATIPETPNEEHDPQRARRRGNVRRELARSIRCRLMPRGWYGVIHATHATA